MIAIMKPICASKHVTLLEFDGSGLVRFCYLQKNDDPRYLHGLIFTKCPFQSRLYLNTTCLHVIHCFRVDNFFYTIVAMAF